MAAKSHARRSTRGWRSRGASPSILNRRNSIKRILITGSTDGVGRSTAEAFIEDGHQVVAHARNMARLAAVQDLIDRGAKTIVGDLSELNEVHDLVEQANSLGPFDAVIHNAGVFRGAVLRVNVTAPYLMTAGIERPGRLIYLSSSMHRGGRPDLSGVDWAGKRETHSYSDSKLFVTTLMTAMARLRPDVVTHAVDPGWVPTRMGGPGASDSLALAHVTQAWLATTSDPEALVSGRYWHHQRTEKTHPAVHDEGFQNELLSSLSEQTGVALPTAGDGDAVG
jgi:NAD(P)-dependent dehydrogenase (short-subunit alcohol dehydrogenase family)